MARRYIRDARGRFAAKGFSGQTGGRGARLKSGKGNTRDTGGARTTKGTGKPKGTISKTKFGRDDDRTNRQLDRDIAAAKGRVAARKKKTKSEGQQYADTQAKAKAARKAETTKRLEAFNKKTQARLDTQTKPAAAKPAANKISKSPRQLNKDEKIARDVMTDKRFKSDRQRVTEMQRRGVKPGTDVVGLVANVRSKQGGGTTSKIKPAAKSGRETMKASVRKVQNQKVRNLNQQIKEAGPNAAGLRLEKLKVQSRMSATRATPTAKQTAKSAQRNDAIRARSAELRRQAGRVNRAYANQARTADTRNKPGSSMIRRPSKKTTRGAIRAEQALKFYRDPKRALNSVNKKRPGFRLPRGMRK